MSSGQYCDDCAEHYFNCSCKSKNIKDGAESITGNAVETVEALRTVLAQPEYAESTKEKHDEFVAMRNKSF